MTEYVLVPKKNWYSSGVGKQRIRDLTKKRNYFASLNMYPETAKTIVDSPIILYNLPFI